MVHPQNPHIGAPPGAALLHCLCGHVEHPHKADGPAGHAAGGIYRAARRPEAGKGEAGAAARLVDQRRLLDGLENILHAVRHRQDEAGGKLPQRPTGVHQRGGIGQEFQLGHHPVEFLLQRRHIRLRLILEIGGGDGPGHPAEQPLHRFHRLAAVVLGQIPAFQHGAGVLTNLHGFESFHKKSWIAVQTASPQPPRRNRRNQHILLLFQRDAPYIVGSSPRDVKMICSQNVMDFSGAMQYDSSRLKTPGKGCGKPGRRRK